MLFLSACPLSAHVSCFGARRPPRRNTHRVFSRERLRARILPRAIKNPTARLAVGDKVKDSAVPPRLTRHRCRVHSSTANTVRLLTRALRPRLLVAFRLGPPGPILSGSVPAGITPSPTLSQSVSRFLPVNGLLSCFYAITAFSPCQRILTRFFKFSARSSPNARRARTRSRSCARCILLSRAPRQIFPPRVSRADAAPRAGSFSARVCERTHEQQAPRFYQRESADSENTHKTTGGSARSCALGKESPDHPPNVFRLGDYS